MVDVWARLEPHLASVQKPARYIGCELGAEVPSPAPGRVGWLLVYPDTYEIGLPEPGPADPLRDPERAPRRRRRALLRAVDRPRGGAAAGGPPAVLGRHPPLGRRVRRAGLQPVGRARLHERPQLPRPGRRAGAGRRPCAPHHPLVGAGGHATYNPEPLADFLDFVVLGDGEEVVGEINEVVARVDRRRSGRARSTSCGRWPGSRACTSRRSTRPATSPTAASRPRCRSIPPRRRSSRSAPSPTWPTGPTRSSSSCRSPRSCTTASTSRCSAAAPGAAGSARPG